VTLFDYIVFAIVGVSMLLGFMRGIVREVFALAAWVVAFIIARTFAVKLLPYMPASIDTPSLRMMSAFLATFVIAFILMMIVSAILTALLKRVGMGSADRGLGVVFGFMRGLAIVLLAVLIGGMTTLPREPSWRHAVSAEWFESVALSLKAWLPGELAKRIDFPSRRVQSSAATRGVRNSSAARRVQSSAATRRVQNSAGRLTSPRAGGG
jgi:membrane protein required for colicin V production